MRQDTGVEVTRYNGPTWYLRGDGAIVHGGAVPDENWRRRKERQYGSMIALGNGEIPRDGDYRPVLEDFKKTNPSLVAELDAYIERIAKTLARKEWERLHRAEVEAQRKAEEESATAAGIAVAVERALSRHGEPEAEPPPSADSEARRGPGRLRKD